MPEHFVDQLDKFLVKSMDFCKFLVIFTEDLKIEGIPKQTKVVKTDIIHRLVSYNPVRSAGLAKLRRYLSDKWF